MYQTWQKVPSVRPRDAKTSKLVCYEVVYRHDTRLDETTTTHGLSPKMLTSV